MVQSDGNYQERAAVDITFGLLMGVKNVVNLLKEMKIELRADSNQAETTDIDLMEK